MQYNGTIQYKVLSGGGLDGNGEPIISTVSWSDPIRCLYKTVKHSNTIYQQGKFTDKSYEILIESRDFQADTVKLTMIEHSFWVSLKYRILSLLIVQEE
mgnify:CR=1 FL=1